MRPLGRRARVIVPKAKPSRLIRRAQRSWPRVYPPCDVGENRSHPTFSSRWWRVRTSRAHDRDADRELDAARAAIDALQARCFVLRTPPEVTPASLWRDRIAKLIRRFPRDATHFVWEPSGVWEVADAAAQARDWNVVLAVDPSREPVPAGAVAYLRLRALGETTSFGPTSLERIANAVGSRREVFAIVETDSAQGEAKQLRRLLRRAAADGGGGGGKLVRPRRGIVVGDDEQE